MHQQGFSHLDRAALERELSTLFTRWAPGWLERSEFIAWAWVVAGAADLAVAQDKAQAVSRLRAERDTIHHGLTELLIATSVVNLRLVAERHFLDWLARHLEKSRAAA